MSYNNLKERLFKINEKDNLSQLGCLDYIINTIQMNDKQDLVSSKHTNILKCFIKKRKSYESKYKDAIPTTEINNILSIDFDKYKDYVVIELQLFRKHIEDSYI